MTQQTRIKFGDMYLMVGIPGTDPVAFSAPCGITTFGKEIVTNTNDVELRDCDDPDAPVWLGIDIISKRMTLNLSGTLDQEAYRGIWRQWAVSEVPWPVRAYERIGATGWGYWEGEGVLTNYTDTANGGGSYTNTGTIVFDGKPVWRGTPPAPSATTEVMVSPTTVPEEDTAFIATAGTYSGSPTLSYQWFADGVAIAGATSINYIPVAADIGKRLRVIETATNASGSTSTRSELSLPVIANV